MSKDQATPRPWTLSDDHKVRRVIKGANGNSLVIVESWTREEDAALIIRAVNSHDALVEALREANDQAQHADGCRWFNHSLNSLGTEAGRAAADADCNCFLKSARAALKLAEAES